MAHVSDSDSDDDLAFVLIHHHIVHPDFFDTDDDNDDDDTLSDDEVPDTESLDDLSSPTEDVDDDDVFDVSSGDGDTTAEAKKRDEMMFEEAMKNSMAGNAQQLTSSAVAMVDESLAHDETHAYSICYEPFNADDHCLATLRCGHFFGRSCIANWVRAPNQRSCPTCRRDAKETHIIALPALGRMTTTNDGERIAQLTAQLADAQETIRQLTAAASGDHDDNPDQPSTSSAVATQKRPPVGRSIDGRAAKKSRSNEERQSSSATAAESDADVARLLQRKFDDENDALMRTHEQMARRIQEEGYEHGGVA